MDFVQGAAGHRPVEIRNDGEIAGCDPSLRSRIRSAGGELVADAAMMAGALRAEFERLRAPAGSDHSGTISGVAGIP
ncbi:MAG: hypothetical protein JO081_03155 [Alphaproteobacteria bacterium]|nr:hypothetical protein [Alphaproteobacteria bacterium]